MYMRIMILSFEEKRMDKIKVSVDLDNQTLKAPSPASPSVVTFLLHHRVHLGRRLPFLYRFF